MVHYLWRILVKFPSFSKRNWVLNLLELGQTHVLFNVMSINIFLFFSLKKIRITITFTHFILHVLGCFNCLPWHVAFEIGRSYLSLLDYPKFPNMATLNLFHFTQQQLEQCTVHTAIITFSGNNQFSYVKQNRHRFATINFTLSHKFCMRLRDKRYYALPGRIFTVGWGISLSGHFGTNGQN